MAANQPVRSRGSPGPASLGSFAALLAPCPLWYQCVLSAVSPSRFQALRLTMLQRLEQLVEAK